MENKIELIGLRKYAIEEVIFCYMFTNSIALEKGMNSNQNGNFHRKFFSPFLRTRIICYLISLLIFLIRKGAPKYFKQCSSRQNNAINKISWRFCFTFNNFSIFLFSKRMSGKSLHFSLKFKKKSV